MTNRLSSETIHATCVALNGQAVLLIGPSGAGKSDLALRLIDRGFKLVSDDQTILGKTRSALIASAPATIAGRMEVRGLGIIEMETVDSAPVALAVELTSDIVRMPDEGREKRCLGLAVPLVSVDAQSASAAVKVMLALDRFGLKDDPQ